MDVNNFTYGKKAHITDDNADDISNKNAIRSVSVSLESDCVNVQQNKDANHINK